MNRAETFIQISTCACQSLIQTGWSIRHAEGIRGIQLVFLKKGQCEYRIAYENFETPALHGFANGRISQPISLSAHVQGGQGGQGGTLMATHEEQLKKWFEQVTTVISSNDGQ